MTPYFSIEHAKELTGIEGIEIRKYGIPESRENYHVFIDGKHHFAGLEYECRIYIIGYVYGMKRNK